MNFTLQFLSYIREVVIVVEDKNEKYRQFRALFQNRMKLLREYYLSILLHQFTRGK